MSRQRTTLCPELPGCDGAQHRQHYVEHHFQGHEPQPCCAPPHEAAVLGALQTKPSVKGVNQGGKLPARDWRAYWSTLAVEVHQA